MNAETEEIVWTDEENFVWFSSAAVHYAEELLAMPDVSDGQWRLLAERVLKIKAPMLAFNGEPVPTTTDDRAAP